MRITIVLVAVLYLIAAFYGYFWWTDRQPTETPNAFSQASSTAVKQIVPEQLSLSETKPITVDQNQLISQQLEQMQAAFAAQFKQMELKQAAAVTALQKQLDELKQAQVQAKAPTKTPASAMPDVQAITTTMDADSAAPPTEQMLEAQVKTAKQRLKAGTSQLDRQLQAAEPDLARQSMLQQKLDAAFNQAELAHLLQGRTECGPAFCKLDLQGKAPEGVDVLQALWEQQVFPEATEVMTMPKSDGSGWVIYVAQDGQSLPNIP